MTISSKNLSNNFQSQIENYSGRTFVIKYGGSIVNNLEAQKAFLEDIASFIKHGIKIILVHGGGPEINKWLKKTSIESRFLQGLRVTDKDTMEIVEMALSGNVNKKLSSALGAIGVNALGISGRDCKILIAKKSFAVDEKGSKIDIGYVGEVISVNSKVLINLLGIGILPVISPVATDGNGNAYNINADYAASSIASALNAEKLIILTDIPGVLKDINNPSSLISFLTPQLIEEYINEGFIDGGMIPKLRCCSKAIKGGAKNVHLIDGRENHALANELFSNSGTRISL
ncbi:acetylglutamate kinase [Clostridium oryzae]|uniref:Acetylglutamate kinase n=1 Tax=Clostridium oryzae TaxID=1450648 RepID=A0A1V4IP38_9CLOT|nr:acetylglutamate kinase [Clostridium oryzae]OPJ61663.1 acetylglutamate kinase [Clostridium oryzae]